MALSKSRLAVLIVLVVAGLYLLTFHKDPLPYNHEAIGLGDLHIVHDVIGAVLLVAAGYLFYVGRRKAPAPQPGVS